MKILWSTNKISRFYRQCSYFEKKWICLIYISYFYHLPSSNLNYSFFNSLPFFIHPHNIFSPPVRFEPTILRVRAWRAIHYVMPPVQKFELKMNLINGFSSIIDLLMNYRIFQYFSLIIFTVLAKLSPCILGMFITQQQHTWSVNFTNSISKFCKYFKVWGNYKKFQ